MWITQNELSQYIQVDFGESDVTEWILQAQGIIESYLNYSNFHIEKTEIIEYHYGNKSSIVLGHYPVEEINYIKIDGDELSEDDYVVYPDGVVYFYLDFMNDKSVIEVNYIAGYEQIPDEIKRACALVVQKLIALSQRGIDLPDSQNLGGVSASWSDIEIIDDNIKNILNKYRRYYVL